MSTVGKKTMINLYDKADKRSFWVEAGATSGGVTVVKYDGERDRVVVRQNGTEKTLPLRAAKGVTNGTATPLPVTPMAPALAPAPAPGIGSLSTQMGPPSAAVGTASAAAPATPTPTGTTSLSQARQEEEARMLVSDLLEIGMAQRKAYEEAQRRAASGQPPVQQTAPAEATAAQPASAQPTATSTPSS